MAPISGSIETTDANPLATAWRELHEETTLTPASLTLWRKGKPYSFIDESVGREWTVHPFAFRLKTSFEGGKGEKAITTDWEHEDWQWYDPDEVVDTPDFRGVPRLKESLRRVWFAAEMNDGAATTLTSGLRRLRRDHRSGSRKLTTIGLGIFREVIVQLREDIDRNPEKGWDILRMVAWHIWKNGRESMGAATLNALLAVLADMEDSAKNGVHDVNRLLGILDRHLERRKSTTARIVQSLTTYLHANFSERQKLTVLTLSESSTVRDSIVDAFEAVDIKTLDIRILESRPFFEGVTFASSVISEFNEKMGTSEEKRLDVKIYTDASAAVASVDVDILLLGSDRISSSGAVSNKVGSLPAVLSAKHISPAVKVIILSEFEKVAEPGGVDDHPAEENDYNEVVQFWGVVGLEGIDLVEDYIFGEQVNRDTNVSVSAKNFYFEWVPPNLIDAFVCEEGVLGPGSIKERSQKIGREIDRIFGGL